jgi:hypothetical protein
VTEKPTVVVPLAGLVPGVPSETRAELVPVTVPVLPASPALRPRLPYVPSDMWFVATPVIGTGIGLAIRNDALWAVVLVAAFVALVVIGRAAARRFGWQLPQHTPKWRAGLVGIACSECSAWLDYATPDFARRHPAPLCVLCRSLVAQGELKRSAVVIPEGDAR